METVLTITVVLGGLALVVYLYRLGRGIRLANFDIDLTMAYINQSSSTEVPVSDSLQRIKPALQDVTYTYADFLMTQPTLRITNLSDETYTQIKVMIDGKLLLLGSNIIWHPHLEFAQVKLPVTLPLQWSAQTLIHIAQLDPAQHEVIRANPLEGIFADMYRRTFWEQADPPFKQGEIDLLPEMVQNNLFTLMSPEGEASPVYLWMNDALRLQFTVNIPRYDVQEVFLFRPILKHVTQPHKQKRGILVGWALTDS